MSSPVLKVALIPVLGGVLAWVSLRDRLEDWMSSDAVTMSPADMGRLGDFLATLAAAAAVPEDSARSAWPVFQLEQIRGADPFGRQALNLDGPTSNLLSGPSMSDASTPTMERRPSQPETQVRPVQAVFESPQGRAALIDHRLVRIGDQLPDGSHVLDISEAGIVLSVP